MTTELRQVEKNRAILKEMVNRKENALCADCGRRRPRWASINLGVFICDTCAGVHRGIGVHITQVRSIDLDDWKNEWVKVMENMGGNIKANEFYEAKNKNPVKTEVTNEAYIREKYVDKKWQGKPAKASKKAAKKESSSEDSASEEEVKPKAKSKKPITKKVESESEEEVVVKPKKKSVVKKIESSDSDSEAEKPKSRKSKKADKVEEAPKKKDQGGFELPLSGKSKSSSNTTTTRKHEATPTSPAWDPFAQGVPPVQEQAGDEWSMFTASPKPAQQAVSTQSAKPAPVASAWDAFGTDDATSSFAGLQVSGSQPKTQAQPAPVQPTKTAPSKGDILGLFDQAPSGAQMGMGMGGMGMFGMGGMPAMGGGMPAMGGGMPAMGGGMPTMGGGMPTMGGGMPAMGGMGMGGMGMMPLMNAQQQQQYMMQQRMNPMQQQQFMMQQQQLMMMMMQQQRNPLFPPQQQQQFPQQNVRPSEPSFF